MLRSYVLPGFWLLAILPFLGAVLKNTITPQMESPFYVEVRRYSQCEEHPNTTMLFEDLNINRVAKDSYALSGYVHVTEDMYGPLFMGAKVHVCKDNPDSCTHLFNNIDKDLCEEIKNKKSKGYEVMHIHLNFKDPKCPLTKGKHEIVSNEFDAKKFESSAVGVKGYRIWLYFYAGDKKTVRSCVYLELAIKEKNQRGKPRNPKKSNESTTSKPN